MSIKTKFLALALGLGLSASTVALAQGAKGAAGSAVAAPNAPAGPIKVGIVNIQEAIAATNEGQKEADVLQKRFAGKQAELKTQNDEVEALKKQLQAQSDKLSDEARANNVKTLETKQKTFQRNLDDYQGEVQQAEQEVLNRLGGKMLSVLEKYGSANGYHVILDVSNPQTPVLWFNPATNVTKAVVDAYNAQSPVAAPARPAGTTGAAAKPAGAATPAKRP